MNKQKFFSQNSKNQSPAKSNMINLEQFINIQRFHKNPIELYQRVEDPFEFARPNRTMFNKKQQFASFVSIGLVKVPQLNLQHKSGISFIPKPTRKLLKKKLNNIVLTSGEQNSSILEVFSSASPSYKRRKPLSDFNFDSPQTLRENNKQPHQRCQSQQMFFPQQMKTEGPDDLNILKSQRPLIMKSYTKVGLGGLFFHYFYYIKMMKVPKLTNFITKIRFVLKVAYRLKKVCKNFSLQNKKSLQNQIQDSLRNKTSPNNHFYLIDIKDLKINISNNNS